MSSIVIKLDIQLSVHQLSEAQAQECGLVINCW